MSSCLLTWYFLGNTSQRQTWASHIIVIQRFKKQPNLWIFMSYWFGPANYVYKWFWIIFYNGSSQTFSDKGPLQQGQMTFSSWQEQNILLFSIWNIAIIPHTLQGTWHLVSFYTLTSVSDSLSYYSSNLPVLQDLSWNHTDWWSSFSYSHVTFFCSCLHDLCNQQFYFCMCTHH